VATIRIAVAWTGGPGEATESELELPVGSTVAEALALAGASAAGAAGVWGRVVQGDRVVESGDRVEAYRALPVDAKEARRRRAAEQRKASKRR
jgi:hypothetical protein